MTLEPERLLMIDLSGPRLTPDEMAFLGEHPLGGVCLFARNIQDRYQVAELTAELRAYCGEALIVATDQEGGGVVRSLDVPFPPGAMALGAADDLTLTEEVAAATARGLRAQGITLDFAPVADVNSNARNPVVADRSFGETPARVAEQVVAFVRGLQREGVAACVKHFPGHGDTVTDSHLGLPLLDVSLERLEALEFVPFRAALASGVAGVMNAHIVLSRVSEKPATLSKAVLTGLLRERLGFRGVIFTDALNMRAIADLTTPAGAVLGALAAGADMPVHVGPLTEHQQIVRALRRALVRFGTLELKAPLTLVGAERVQASAASQATVSPVQGLAEAFAEAGLPTTVLAYERVALGGARDDLLRRVAQAPGTVVFVSAARTRMAADERDFARAVARCAASFAHIALWNPYHVEDLPGPALVSFGFRERSLRAVARAHGEASGTSPVTLEPNDL